MVVTARKARSLLTGYLKEKGLGADKMEATRMSNPFGGEDVTIVTIYGFDGDLDDIHRFGRENGFSVSVYHRWPQADGRMSYLYDSRTS